MVLSETQAQQLKEALQAKGLEAELVPVRVFAVGVDLGTEYLADRRKSVRAAVQEAGFGAYPIEQVDEEGTHSMVIGD